MAKAKADKIPYPFHTVTQEMIDRILKDISEGSTNKHAARSNGLCEAHFYNLINQGLVDLSVGKNDTLQAKMVVSLSKIEQKEIKECRKEIKASDKGHRGCEWTLEHAYSRDFGTNKALEEITKEVEELKSILRKGESANGE